METEFWIAIFLDLVALALVCCLARKKQTHTWLVKLFSPALGLVFIFATAANCANGIHTPLIPSLIGLALSSAASCLALEGAPAGGSHE